MLTTAGSTRVTIPENDAEDGIGSGNFSGVAFVPANADIAFIADVRPDTIEPIRMPTTSVRTRNADARSLRRRAQLKISRTCCPIACVLQSSRKNSPPSQSITPAFTAGCGCGRLRQNRYCTKDRVARVFGYRRALRWEIVLLKSRCRIC